MLYINFINYNNLTSLAGQIHVSQHFFYTQSKIKAHNITR